MKEQKLLGGLKPEDALEYLKNAPDAVIVQVNTAEWKIEPGFKGALWIPHDEIAQRCDEIPSGRPVILHCGAGVVSVPAYETLIEKRPDIPELGYIAGRPHEIMKEYNEWLIEEASSDPSLTIAETEQTNSMSANLVQTPPQGVRLTFHYTKAATEASNQFAVWIEDSEGNIVKTIAVTDFTEQGGYDKREDALPKWVKAADPAKSAAEQIDAVSSATPATGNLEFVWDGTDQSGNKVKQDIYTLKLEGTLYWSSDVIYSGTVDMASGSGNIPMNAVYTENTETNRDMITDVHAEYR